MHTEPREKKKAASTLKKKFSQGRTFDWKDSKNWARCSVPRFISMLSLLYDAINPVDFFIFRSSALVCVCWRRY